MNAFVTEVGNKIVVLVKDVAKVPGTPWYNEHFVAQEEEAFHYTIPKVHLQAVRKYQQGKYSEMGEMAIGMIRAYSGLNYMKERWDDFLQMRVTDTDARILALEKHPDLKERLEELLSWDGNCGWVTRSIVEISPDAELMSPPTKFELWEEKTLTHV